MITAKLSGIVQFLTSKDARNAFNKLDCDNEFPVIRVENYIMFANMSATNVDKLVEGSGSEVESLDTMVARGWIQYKNRYYAKKVFNANCVLDVDNCKVELTKDAIEFYNLPMSKLLAIGTQQEIVDVEYYVDLIDE